MPRTATPREYELGDQGRCQSEVPICVHPAEFVGGTWAISARDERDVITQAAEDERPLEEHACSCGSLVPHRFGDVLGVPLDDGSASADEPAESEARPLRRDESGVEVVLDANELALRIDGRPVGLTRTQFSLLAYLIQNTGRWITTSELIRQVLGTHHQPDTSLVRVHVHAIRRRLGSRAAWLESDRRRARGYRWRQFDVECDDAKQESS